MALLLVTVTLSMMTTPLLMKLVDKWLSRQFNGPEEEDEKPWVNDDKPQVIVVGFGRFGQVIGRLLMANKMRITVLERDISAVNLMRKYGYKVYYGDATQVDLLRSAGAEAAESIVITCNEPEDTMKLVEICQQHFPHLHILARARGRVEAHELLQAGVTQFSRETFSSAFCVKTHQCPEKSASPGIFISIPYTHYAFFLPRCCDNYSKARCGIGALPGVEEDIMDYEFLRDITGVVKVRMSMGHEVVGHWFNEEVKENLALLDEVEQAARAVKGSERSWQRAGHEYTLWLDGEEVMVRANQLELSGDEMEEGMSYYDEESFSLCGVEDFLQVVAAYREFVQQR